MTGTPFCYAELAGIKFKKYRLELFCGVILFFMVNKIVMNFKKLKFAKGIVNMPKSGWCQEGEHGD
ncbi:hypothetical protein TMM008_02010 [Pseudomonas sp. 008]|nr:hypothetical protein TMM008_02010 [Pseudomonas sp. 008]